MASRKTRRFTEEERVIFQAGVSEGESRRQAAAKRLKEEHKEAIAKLQTTITNMKKTNGELWEANIQLDTNTPLVGVLVPLRAANRILAYLMKHSAHHNKLGKGSLSAILKCCIGKSESRNLRPIADHLTAIADESFCERPPE